MNDAYSILIAVSGWAAWAMKETLSALLKRRMSRAGLHSFIEGRTRLLFDCDSRNAGIVSLELFPGMAKHSQFSDARRFRIEIDGQLFNDTDTQCIYKKPVIEFWGVEGLRCTHKNPSFATFAGGEWRQSDPSSTITVPSHATTRLRFEIPIAIDFTSAIQSVSDLFYDTVLLLRVETMTGRERRFRMCTSSFCGSHNVVWPPNCKYPIYNVYALNIEGRRAGRRAQPARAFSDSTD